MVVTRQIPDMPDRTDRESVRLLKTSIAAGHSVTLTVASSSMRPFLLPGDRIVCAGIPTFRPGDCVAYETPQGIVTHRILRIAPQGVLVKGDANRRADEPVLFHRIIGAVISVERGGLVRWRRDAVAACYPHLAAALSSAHAFGWSLLYAVRPKKKPSEPVLEPLDRVSRNILLLDRTNSIVVEARQARVEIIALKGIRYLCGICRLDQRELSDIDLLVKPQDIPAMRSILSARGYRCDAPIWRPRRGHSRYLNAEVWRAVGTTPHFVHLHWHLLNSTLPLTNPRFDMDAIWHRSIALGGDGLACRALSAADECVYAAMHAFLHGYDRPQVAEDIRRLFSYHNLSRHELLHAAEAVGAQVPMVHAFSVIDGAADPVCGHNGFAHSIARMQGGFFARLFFYAGIVFPPPSVIRALFPGVPLFFAYGSRMIRAIFRHGIC